MSRPRFTADVAAATILVAVAAITVRLLVTGEYLTYVRPAMAPFLATTAAFLVLLAGWTLCTIHRREPSRQRDQAHLPVVAWLLLWPVMVVLVVAPDSLGAFTANRSEPAPLPPTAAGFVALPAGDPLGVPLDIYVERASYGGSSTLEGRRFTILGFVSHPKEPGSWYLTRLMLRCCAADALPLQIRAVGAAPQEADVWLVVTGTYLPNGRDGTPQLQVEAVEPATRPTRPYVYG